MQPVEVRYRFGLADWLGLIIVAACVGAMLWVTR